MKNNELLNRIASLNKRLDGIVSVIYLLEQAGTPFSNEVFNRAGDQKNSDLDNLILRLPGALESVANSILDIEDEYTEIMCMIRENNQG